jgi:hypothetical protein
MIDIDKSFEYNGRRVECIIYGWNGEYSECAAEWGEEEIYIPNQREGQDVTDLLSDDARRRIVYEMLSIAYDDSREDMARGAM